MGQTILKWHKKGYIMGPYPEDHPIKKKCRINPVFCVPKPGDEVRPVVNYSKAIKGKSLNDLLDPEWCTVEYIKIKEIVFTIHAVGKGAMMWAKDLEDGYFNIKVHPSVTKQMAWVFAGLLFIPMVMIFGLSTAPLIFTMFMWFVVSAIRLTDSDVMWLAKPMKGFDKSVFQTDADLIPDHEKQLIYFPLIMYYLDDIFGVHTPELVQKQYNLAGKTLLKLGLSAKESKDKPPANIQIILGLEFDSIAQEVRVPQDKVDKYSQHGRSLMRMKQITKRDLFSLTGKVRWSAMYCRPLAAYARGIEIYGHKHNLQWHHHINMNNALKRDINLVIEGLQTLRKRGTSFEFILHPKDCIQMEAFTDAAGSIGIGGYVAIDQAPYFQVKWSEVHMNSNRDIQWKELVAIVVLIECNASRFRNKYVCIWSDNRPVIDMLIKWRATLRRPDLQHLIRKIAKICIDYNIRPWWEHIEGKRNVIADRLSRFHQNPFEFARTKPREHAHSRAATYLQKNIDLCE